MSFLLFLIEYPLQSHVLVPIKFRAHHGNLASRSLVIALGKLTNEACRVLARPVNRVEPFARIISRVRRTRVDVQTSQPSFCKIAEVGEDV
jgi:hypothetical protein